MILEISRENKRSRDTKMKNTETDKSDFRSEIQIGIRRNREKMRRK